MIGSATNTLLRQISPMYDSDPMIVFKPIDPITEINQSLIQNYPA